MIVEFKKEIEKDFEIEVGNILVSEDNDVHLVIQNEMDCFEVFDLEENVSRFYTDAEDFDEDFPIKEEYYPNEIRLRLEK